MGVRCTEVCIPGIKMGIEMHQSHRPVVVVYRPEQRHGDGMVSAKAYDVPDLPQQLCRGGLNLIYGLRYRVRIARYIPCIGDLKFDERFPIVGRVVLGAKVSRGLAYGLWAEPGARPVAGAAIEWNAQDGHIAALNITRFRQPCKGRRARKTGNDCAADWSYGRIL